MLLGLSHAEALKKVPTQIDGSKTEVTRNSNASCGGCEIPAKKDTLVVGKNDFVLVMVEVIYLSGRKTEKIKIIVKAAEKYLGMKKLIWEAVERKLSGGNSQAWIGGS